MDDSYHLKIKIGAHEFEATGSPELVKEQFAAFKEMVAGLPPATPQNPQFPPAGEQIPPAFAGTKQETPNIDNLLDKIMRLENRVISLTVRPNSTQDAVLLLLYGQKVMRGNEAVTGSEVMDGITATGGFSVLRVDRLLENLGRNGDVIVIGEHRGKRYRLTNAGMQKARQFAAEMIALVA